MNHASPQHPLTAPQKETFHKDFETPPPAYRGKPFWSWNGKLEKEELLRQIEVLKTMGMGGAFMHSRTGLQTEYLGKEWFELINACSDAFAQLGFEGWLYDEDRWPSGSAGGIATREQAYRMQYVRLTVYPARNSTLPLPVCPLIQPGCKVVALFAAKVENLNLSACRRIPRNETLSADASATGAVDASLSAKEIADIRQALPADESLLLLTSEIMPEHSFYNGATYLDTMNAEATQHFIDITHNAYLRACGDRMGSAIRGIFTDEPHRGFVMCNVNSQEGPASPAWVTPWTTRLPEVFRERWGYDLIEHLPELFLHKDGQSVSQVKWHYMETIQTLFIENWAKPLQDWCTEHNLQLTGHVLHEDSLGAQATPCGSMMRYYEHMDVPGVDILTSNNRNYWVVKQLASVARQQQKPWMLSELYGCTGWQTDFAKHKEIGDWQALLGINVRCHHLSWYTMAGEAKRDYPASIFFQSSWYPEYKVVEDYYARIHLLLQRGQAVCDLLVIHPVESIWAQIHAGWATWLTTHSPALLPLEKTFADTFHMLVASGIDFDYADEEHLQRFATLTQQTDNSSGRENPKSPKIQLGHMRYRTVLVSGCVTLRRSTLALLESFVQAGGNVIFAGDPPTFVDALPSQEPAHLATRSNAVPFEESALHDMLHALNPSALRVHEPEAAATLEPLLRQLRQDGDIWIIALHNPETNHDRKHCTIELDCPAASLRVAEWDARTGERSICAAQMQNGTVHWQTSLAPLGERLFVVTTHTETQLPQKKQRHAIEQKSANGPFTFSLDEPNALVLDTPEWLLGNAAGTCHGAIADDSAGIGDAVMVGDSAVAGNAIWNPPLEILKIDNAVRTALHLPDRSGTMLQPWARAQSNTKQSVAAPSTPLRLRYTIQVREAIATANITLVLEQPERWHAVLNGQPVSLEGDDRWFIDPCLRRIALPKDCLKTGSNTLELRADFDESLDLEACYLLGDFGVWFAAGQPVLGKLPDVLTLGDASSQGLPFYSGRISYHLPLPPRFAAHCAESTDAVCRLHLPDFGGAVAVLYPSTKQQQNAKDNSQQTEALENERRILPFPPYDTELDATFMQHDSIVCEIVLTRRNIFGPLHMLPKDVSAIGPESFRTQGKAWSEGYQLMPSGLLEAPVFTLME